MVYCDILWYTGYTVIYCDILDILWYTGYTVVYCDILWYTVQYTDPSFSASSLSLESDWSSPKYPGTTGTDDSLMICLDTLGRRACEGWRKERSWEREKISLVPRLPFGTHLFNGRGRRANELNSAGLTQLSKVLVLREKAISRVDGL